MSSRPLPTGGPASTSAQGPDRQGSVKRARQLLEAGVRPSPASPPVPVPAPMPRPPPPSGRPSPTARNLAHQTQWPLPDSGLPPRSMQPQPLNPQHPRYLMPRGPPPFRPPRPSEVPSQVPSPSIYSVRSGVDSETNSVYPMQHARSFSHPKPLFVQHPQHARSSTVDGPVSPTSTVDLTPRISIATDELFHRQSTASGSSSAPDVPPIPLPEPPSYPQESSRQRAAGLAPPPTVHKSAFSPIPEEFPNPRQTLGSLASSRVIPSSWGSGPPESEILGAYLDNESEDEDDRHSPRAADVTLVRNASLGKRGKPTVRTIIKSSPNSEEVPIPDLPSANPKEKYRRQPAAAETAGGLAVGTAVSQVLHAPSTGRRTSVSTESDESYVDPEKPRFAQQHDHPIYSSALEKELEMLPNPAPTMSDKRPGGRKPPRLDMNAVRDAEARGSLSSLSDLIRRATKLASNLDRGKTASRCDVLGTDADFKAALGEPGHRRGSGSISDLLTSFPRPGFQTPEGRSSWPVFFSRSGLRNVEPLHSNDENPDANRPARKCCGIPRKWFVVLCILLFIIVVLAILLPVFLVAVPKQNHTSSTNSCATTNPCQNGGVSVSSGADCSCVCANGYTGSQCTVAGDSSCVTSEAENGAISKNATMGSDLPYVFSASSSKFNITLDSVTIMALFSMNNVSCKTENALVTFDNPTSGSKTRRAVFLPMDVPESADEEATPMSALDSTTPTPVLVPRSLATSNGILYDNAVTASATSTESTAKATTTSIPASSDSASANTNTSASTGTDVPTEVVEFSQVAVLYILEKTGSLTSAMWSEGQIQTYLTDSYANATHPTLQLMESYGLDFEKKTITLRNGTVVS
ncbi:hypothetical protein F1880_008963 [Penicillium rolfsii]|nr:hypothetical protein F1880_008963 [Penicillium rolfsii]